MVDVYLPTSVPKRNEAQIKVIALRAARNMCIKLMMRKMRKYGKVLFQVTVIYNPDWESDGERAAVDEIIRQERGK